MAVPYERVTIPVSGGSIAAGRWGTGDNIVLAAHGITANHLSWQRIAQMVVERSDDSTSIVAIDLRGRAGSAETPGPFGLTAHADDLVAALDHFDLDSAVLTGHSLGGFIVSVAAEQHPDRVDRLVLVDGGIPFPGELPVNIDVEAAVQAVIGPALDRLDQRWPDIDAYVDFFRAHPAFQPPNEWTDAVEAYVRHDAVETPEGEIRSSCAKEAVLTDGGAVIVDPRSASAITRISTPADFVWAPRGILDEEPGLYNAEYLAYVGEPLPHLTTRFVPGTNHYTIAVADVGATAVADSIIGRSI